MGKNDLSPYKSLHVCCQLTRADFSLNVDLTIPLTGITAIFGHSGSGKTTLLRIIAGLENTENSTVKLGNSVWQHKEQFEPTHRRKLGFVFQEANLFSHLTAAQNLQYAIKRADEPVSEQYINHIIALLGIKSILKQYPVELSGGEAQRVAIARALLIKPSILLMDEPLASLDDARKKEILPYLEKLHYELNIPILYVSHAMNEVARLADYAIVMDQGQVAAQGSLDKVFASLDIPMDEQSGVVLSGIVKQVETKWHMAVLSTDNVEFWLPDAGIIKGQSIRIQVLAKDVAISLSCPQDTSVLNRIPVRIIEIRAQEESALVFVKMQINDSFIIARLTRKSLEGLSLKENMKVWALIKSVAIVR